MASSLSNLVNNLSEGYIESDVNLDTMIKNVKICGIRYKYCNCFLEYTNFKDDLIEFKCLCCKKKYQNKFHEKLKERLFNTYKFSNHESNKFILLL